MKRKDFEDAYDDFSCLSLAASARKSRRLDCEFLPPIIEEESDVTVLPAVPDIESGSNLVVPNEAAPVVDSVVSVPRDRSQELAIVLYNPANAANQKLVKSPSSSRLSLVMNPELLSGFRSHILHDGGQSRVTIIDEDEESNDDNGCSNDSMAVVPWSVSHSQQPQYQQQQPAMFTSEEAMEADGDCDMMEAEEDASTTPGHSNWNPGYVANDGMMGGVVQAFRSQQQPYCLLPQYPPNSYTPITW